MNAKLNLRCFALLFMIIGAKFSFAQEISSVFLSDNVGDPLDAICVKTDANVFEIRVTLNGSFVNAENNNIFILELSDITGSFNDPETIQELARTESSSVYNNINYPNPIVISDLFGNDPIAFPENVASENYKIRIRSTNPEVTSEDSQAFSAFFYDGKTIAILKEEPNSNGGYDAVIVDTICEESVVLTATEAEVFPMGGFIPIIPSTVTFFQWSVQNEATGVFEIIPGENGSQLTVTQAGRYRASRDLGICNVSNGGFPNGVDTNDVLVSLAGNGPGGTDIVDATNTVVTNTTITLCQTEALELLPSPTLTANTYKWFRDGNALDNAGLSKLIVGDGADILIVPGVYTLETAVNGADCPSVSQVTVSLINPGITIDNPDFLPISGDDQVTLNAVTAFPNPDLQWFQGPFAIPGATGTSIVVTAEGIGEYRVRLLASSECGSETFSNTVTVFTPQNYTIAIAFEEPALEGCDIDQRTLIIEEVLALGQNNAGTTFEVTISPSIYDTLPLNWQLAGLDIDNANETTYIVDDFQALGNYTLRIGTGVSNELDVNLRVPISELSPSSPFLCFGSTVTIMAFSETFSYRWFFNGALVEGETSNTLEADKVGTYQAEVTAPGCSLTLTEELVLVFFGDDVINVDPGFTVDMGSLESQTLTASGGESYIWEKVTKDEEGEITSRELVSIEASLTVTNAIFDEGQVINYVLTSTVGECEVVNEIKIKRELSDLIPNLITANGDDINDRWVIPSAYVNKEEVEITIYTIKGEIDFMTTNYQNDWPETFSKSSGSEPIYYYIINNTVNGETQKGSISVMR